MDSLYLNFKRNRSDIRGKGKFLKVKLDNCRGMDAEHYLAQNAHVVANDAGKIRLEVVDTLRKNLRSGSRIISDDDPKIIIDERKIKREKAQQEAEKANRQ